MTLPTLLYIRLGSIGGSQITMNGQTELPRLNKILSYLLPVRIVTILSIVVLFPPLKLSWQFSTIIFTGFILLFIGSFVMELVLISKLKELRKTFWPLYNKYTASFPFEFMGVFVFAMYSFKPNTGAIDWDEVKFASIVLVGGVVLEILHRFVYPRLDKKHRSAVILKKELDLKDVLSIIALVVLVFFVGFYGVLVSVKLGW